MLESGLILKEVIDCCKDAKEYGVDVLNISRGNIITAVTLYEVAPVDIKNGFNVEDGERIRKETGMFTMPCGRINTPEVAEKILEDDKADLIVMARAQLADANFCNKAKNGQVNQIRYCSNSLYDPSIKHITCIRNPGLLEEATDSLSMTSHPKKVVIASEKEYLLDGVIMVVVLNQMTQVIMKNLTYQLILLVIVKKQMLL